MRTLSSNIYEKKKSEKENLLNDANATEDAHFRRSNL